MSVRVVRLRFSKTGEHHAHGLANNRRMLVNRSDLRRGLRVEESYSGPSRETTVAMCPFRLPSTIRGPHPSEFRQESGVSGRLPQTNMMPNQQFFFQGQTSRHALCLPGACNVHSRAPFATLYEISLSQGGKA